MALNEALREFQRIEANTRHDVAIFLILYSLIGLDIFSIKDEKQREKVTAAWVSWGVVFVLVGFFILAPERDAQAIRIKSHIDPER
ncbi:hypothetical protein [Alicyclobacillus acidiphilus]|uniref:hypothetical protein n=1 Tax=Alicyclobacillus acidiphilus TaxID=182455 RepID=UPI0012ED0D06|nr:hypothetical protein [Alicyclobacillus acidiphilus]